MPITSTVCRLREESGGMTLEVSESSPKVSKELSAKYSVDFAGATNPSQVDSMMALSATGVPVLGQAVYRRADGKIFPYILAISKTATRSEENAYRFTVDVQFGDLDAGGDSGSEEAEDKPDDPEDLDPVLTWSVEGEQMTAWSEDASVKNPDPKPCLLPTGTLYSSPTLRNVPTFVATVVQYDNSFTLEKLKERIFMVNKKKWQGFAPYHAFIKDIKWQLVKIPLANDTEVSAYKITYTIHCRNYEIMHREDNGTIKKKTVGWETVRIRSDSMVNAEAGDPTSKILPTPKHPAAGIGDIYLKSDGTMMDAQNGVPPMDFLRLDKIGEFKKAGTSGFLRI